MNALSISNLQKTYRNGVQALRGIDLAVPTGEFFGLLGPNGAGKTTCIGIVTGLVNKTGGSVEIFGKDLDKNFHEARRQLGVVPQEFNFNIFERVYDVVVQQAGYYGLPRRAADCKAEKYLKQLDLWDKRHVPAGELSGGMKRRLMIARAQLHEPKLLILDEPTAGVDVELRRSTWQFLRKLNQEGITIILTTHYLEEAETLCNQIAIINQGRIIENTNKRELIRKLDRETFVLDLDQPVSSIEVSGNWDLKRIDETTLEVEIGKEDNVNTLFRHLDQQGITVVSMKNKANRLEELFLHLTEKK
ncbi:MAG: ABC transporter ATP-binding protein [Planctomycetota bacterium]